jgi:hypothetical protein
VSLETELDHTKKNNEDLRKTLEINKTLITQLLQSSPLLELSVKDGIWAMESLLEQARSECAEVKNEIAKRDHKMEALKRHFMTMEKDFHEQINVLKEAIERKEY